MPELDNENWLTDIAFLVNLTAHLNELKIGGLKMEAR